MAIAGEFAQQLKSGDIVLLDGDLGAGKTTFTKGIAQALRVNPKSVTSPTFVLMNHYAGKLPLYHFDLYRLEKESEIQSMNFDEFFYGEGVSLIEWPQRLGELLPKQAIRVLIEHQGLEQRKICIVYP